MFTLKFSLNRSMMYSLADTFWVAIMWLNPILSLVILYHSAKVAKVFAKTNMHQYPSGFWTIAVIVVFFSIVGAILIMKSKKASKFGSIIFASIIPIFILGFSFYRLYELTGSI